MMVTFFLGVHLLTAVWTGVVILQSLVAVMQKSSCPYLSQLEKRVITAGIFSISSGVVLSVLSEASIRSTCIKLALYLGAVISTYAALLVKRHLTNPSIAPSEAYAR
jgi:hypothetical protein